MSAPLSARVATVALHIPGNSTTSETIAVGGARADTLEVAGDEDWFWLTLAAGQSVTIELTGAGASALSDPFLWLYDSSGTLVSYNDDGGPGLGSLVEFTASASATYFVADDSYGGLIPSLAAP